MRTCRETLAGILNICDDETLFDSEKIRRIRDRTTNNIRSIDRIIAHKTERHSETGRQED